MPFKHEALNGRRYRKTTVRWASPATAQGLQSTKADRKASVKPETVEVSLAIQKPTVFTGYSVCPNPAMSLFETLNPRP